MQSKRKAFWLDRARAEAFRFNFGWWVQLFVPWVFWSLLGAGCLIFYVRILEADSPVGAVVLGLGLAVGAGLAVWKAHAHWISVPETLVKLDAKLELHNALTCASEGVADWPEAKPGAHLDLAWNLRRLWRLPCLGAVAVMAALLLPVPERDPSSPPSAGEPSTWSALQETLDTLEPGELVQTEALDTFREALEALRDQPNEAWFSHESLEAGDHLLESAHAGLQDLRGGLEQALAALEASRQIDEHRLGSHGPLLEEYLQTALQQLASGSMPLNEDLLNSLQDIDLSKSHQLTAEQWKDLQARLKEGVALCSGEDGQGEGEGEGEGTASQLLAALLAGQGGTGTEGSAPTPLQLSDTPTDLATRGMEAISNEDLSHALPGDLLGVGLAEHTDTPLPESPQSGGSLPAIAGGHSASNQKATPDEQRVLKAFFQ